MLQEAANPLSFCINHIYLLLQISNVYFTNRGSSCFTGAFKKNVRFLFVKKKKKKKEFRANLRSLPGQGIRLVGWLHSGDMFLLPAGAWGSAVGGWNAKGRCCFSFSGFSSVATNFFWQQRIKVPQDSRGSSRKGDVIFFVRRSCFRLWFDPFNPFLCFFLGPHVPSSGSSTSLLEKIPASKSG